MKIVTQHMRTQPGPYQTRVALPPEMRSMPLAFVRANNWPTFPEGVEYALANAEAASVKPAVWLNRDTACHPYQHMADGAGVLARAFADSRARILAALARHLDPALLTHPTMAQAQSQPLPGPITFPKVPYGGARQIAPAQWPKSTLTPTHLPTPSQLSMDTSVIKAAAIAQRQADVLATNAVVGATGMLAHKRQSAMYFAQRPTHVRR